MTSEIKDIAIQEQLRAFREAIVAGVVVIDGQEITLPIYQTRTRGNTLRIYLKLDSDTRGFISKARLIDGLGRTWQEKEYNYNKGADGFIIVFPYRYTVQPFVDEEERAQYE